MFSCILRRVLVTCSAGTEVMSPMSDNHTTHGSKEGVSMTQQSTKNTGDTVRTVESKVRKGMYWIALPDRDTS